MKYFKVFNTENEYLEYIHSEECITPYVITLRDSSNTWISAEIHDYSKDYFTIESLGDNNVISLKRSSGNANQLVLAVSTDDGDTWQNVTIPSDNTDTELITLNSGGRALVKNVSGKLSEIQTAHTYFSSSENFNIEGNIMSITRGDDFQNITSTTTYEFSHLFKDCTTLVSASNLILEAQSIGGGGYQSMFNSCTSLTGAPQIYATSATTASTQNMFSGCTSLVTPPSLNITSINGHTNLAYMFASCTSLTTVPSLPATTMRSECYKGMFENCTSLTTVPELPATTLTTGCYNSMFKGCTSLTAAPSLPATTMGSSAYAYMFSGCTSLTTVQEELPATTMEASCYRGMFDTCTSLITAPELPATTLASECYRAMFADCSNLTTVSFSIGDSTTTIPASACTYMFTHCTSLTTTPSLPAVTIGDSGYKGMFDNCSHLTTASELPATTLADGCYASMFNTCTSLIAAPTISATTLGASACTYMFSGCTALTTVQEELPATTLTESCYRLMFQNCTSLTTAPELPATTLADSCYRAMFQNCTSLTTALALPATTLADYCYRAMFMGCTSLTTAPVLSATTLGNQCCYEMFRGCTNLTTAPELSATTMAASAYTYMFSGCTALTTVQKELPATTLAAGCYSQMFGGCTSLTTAPELPATTLVDRCYNRMFLNCRNLNYIKMLSDDNGSSVTEPMLQWVSGVTNTNGLFIKSSLNTEITEGPSGIPVGWTVHNDTHIEVTGVTISASAATVNKGSTYTLTANVLPSNADDQVVSWSTSDSSVATVSNGVVTGVGCGNATITVTTHESGYTATCNMSVENHVTSVDLNAYQLYLNSGSTYQFEVTVLPADACDKSVTWASSDDTIVTVDSNGVVSGVTTGEAVVTVTTVDRGLTKNCTVTVNEGQHVTGVSLSDAVITVNKDEAYTLTATVMPNDAVDKRVTWSSSDDTIATVDSNGVVSGVASGDATITVTTVDGGYTAQCNVSVTNIHDYSEDYFTIESLEDSNAVKIHRWGMTGNTEFYSLDNGTTWTQVPTGNSEITIATINSGETVLIKSEAQQWANSWTAHNSLTCSKNYNVYGNIMSLIYGDSFIDQTVIKNTSGNSGGTFMGLFWYTSSSAVTAEGSTTLISAENLVLPATTLKARTYNEMFRGCVNLQYPPKELPAINLTEDCYGSMFELCRSLRVAPVIKAEKTAIRCCQRMFCVSRSGATAVDSALTTAPVLLPKTLANNSYQEMFAGNKNLNYIKCLATDISGASALTNWVSSVASSGTFVKDPTMVSWGVGKNGIPSGWTISNNVIKSFCISATTDSVVSFTNDLQYSYNNEMWTALPSNTNLNIQTDEKVYFKSTITPTSTNGIGHFNITGSVSVGGNPSSLMVGDSIESLSGYDYAFKGLLSGCTSITDASSLIMHKTLSTSCYEGMFCGCTNLTTSPKLPASTLVSDCYKEMFSGCTSLNYIEALFLTEPSTSYTSNWVSGVAASGEFKTDINIGWDVESNRGVNGIPQSWNVGYGYIELEYIASTSSGGQYIDLDIMLYNELNKWYDIAIKFNAIGAGKGGGTQPTIFACQENATPWPGTFIRREGSNNNVIGRYIGGSAKDNKIGSMNSTIELSPKDAPNMNVYNLNNSNKTHTWGTSLFCIFNNQAKTAFDRFTEAKLYYFKLYSKENQTSQGVLVRDMIPCKTSNGTVGLFDKANNKLYVSLGEVAFEAGPEINS